jgi:hypothetical protein
MRCPHAVPGCKHSLEIEPKWAHNLLLCSVEPVIGRVATLKERVRAFYFEVMLSSYQCPRCGGRLYMAGQSQAGCACGHTLDPTVSFQRSPCCGMALVKKTFHYACSGCRKSVPSRFLFDEKVFDAAYFREMMQESRARAIKRRDEIARLLAESRSGALLLTDDPCLYSLVGFTQDLDLFIKDTALGGSCTCFEAESGFHMEQYRDHILSVATWSGVLFSRIAPLIEDNRQDKVWRFVTVVFMDNEREVDLSQHCGDIRVQRVCRETHA